MPSFVQVLLSQVRDPVHDQYQQLHSYYRKFLPNWLWEEQPCKLQEKIKYNEYPPCIHMDLRYDDPTVRQEVVTILKISTGCNPTNYLPLTVKGPSELLIV